MELIKRIVTRKKQAVLARCEDCGRELEIPYTNTTRPEMPSIDLKNPVRCECGEYHNLVLEKKSVDNSGKQSKGYTDFSVRNPTDNSPIKCPRCGSTQIHSGNKGFGLGKAAAGGLLAGPVGLLGGLVGSKKVVITCLKCGYKWRAGEY